MASWPRNVNLSSRILWFFERERDQQPEDLESQARSRPLVIYPVCRGSKLPRRSFLCLIWLSDFFGLCFNCFAALCGSFTANFNPPRFSFLTLGKRYP